MKSHADIGLGLHALSALKETSPRFRCAEAGHPFVFVYDQQAHVPHSLGHWPMKEIICTPQWKFISSDGPEVSCRPIYVQDRVCTGHQLLRKQFMLGPIIIQVQDHNRFVPPYSLGKSHVIINVITLEVPSSMRRIGL